MGDLALKEVESDIEMQLRPSADVGTTDFVMSKACHIQAFEVTMRCTIALHHAHCDKD